jgi:hypothetical protein
VVFNTRLHEVRSSKFEVEGIGDDKMTRKLRLMAADKARSRSFHSKAALSLILRTFYNPSASGSKPSEDRLPGKGLCSPVVSRQANGKAEVLLGCSR